MKYGYIIIAAIVFGSCSGGAEIPDPDGVPVLLPVGSPHTPAGRAAVDAWNKTTISLAYREESQVFSKYVNVVIENNNEQTIHTGMQYPKNGGTFYVRGYHPAAAPTAEGIVRYDISRGDVDLMSTVAVSGDRISPIIADPDKKLLFSHRLTRLTFNMTRTSEEPYPERIAAVLIYGSDVRNNLPTQAELNLATNAVTFRLPGVILAGYRSEGLLIPPNGAAPTVIEAMVKPLTPLKIGVISTGDDLTEIPLDGSTLRFLETTGGIEGEQYIINLSFRSASPLGRSIEATEWEKITMPGSPSGNNNQWW